MQTVESIKCNYRAIAKHIMYFVLTLTVSTTLMVPLAGWYILKDFLFISFWEYVVSNFRECYFTQAFMSDLTFFIFFYFDSSLVLNCDTNLQVKNPFTDTFFSWFFFSFPNLRWWRRWIAELPGSVPSLCYCQLFWCLIENEMSP